MDGVNEQLGNTPFVIAYRFATEYALYEAAWAKLNGIDVEAATDDDKKNLAEKALDHVVMMKLFSVAAIAVMHKLFAGLFLVLLLVLLVYKLVSAKKE